jgi:hypothetical protein
MKKSVFPLILLLVVCFSLPLLLKLSEGMTTWTDPSGNTHYEYSNDLDSLAKSKTMDPTEDIATPNSNLPSNFFDSVHTGSYYADDGEDESKYIMHSKNFKGYLDASNNLTSYASTNVTNTNTQNNPSSTDQRISTDIGIIQFLRNLFKRNTESFDTRRVVDSSDNAPYDISDNYELYNVGGKLGMGVHDTTDYGSMLDVLEQEFKDLQNKQNTLNVQLQGQQSQTMSNPIKCIADFATNIGEELCCGQTGVLQDTKYVCPSNQPTCSNFKCGSAFGTCS